MSSVVEYQERLWIVIANESLNSVAMKSNRLLVGDRTLGDFIMVVPGEHTLQVTNLLRESQIVRLPANQKDFNSLSVSWFVPTIPTVLDSPVYLIRPYLDTVQKFFKPL
jgi:hypothetical protein